MCLRRISSVRKGRRAVIAECGDFSGSQADLTASRSRSRAARRAPRGPPAQPTVTKRASVPSVSRSGKTAPFVQPRAPDHGRAPSACWPRDLDGGQRGRSRARSISAAWLAALSVSGCSAPSTRRRASSTSSWSSRARASSPWACRQAAVRAAWALDDRHEPVLFRGRPCD